MNHLESEIVRYMNKIQEEEETVDRFAKKMKEKLAVRRDRYYPMGWKTLDQNRLINLLESEIKELLERKEGSAGEAVDIANYAMFLWEILNGEHN